MYSKQVARLRGWMRKHAMLGTLLVGGYLGLHYLWSKRRTHTIAAAMVLLLGAPLLWLRAPASHHRVLADGSPVSVKPPRVHVASPHPDLLDRAKRVADTRTWALAFNDYYWLSNDEILYSGGIGSQVFRENINTHVCESLPRLSSLTEGLSTKHSQVRLSPDRRWLLWTDADSEQVIATTIDGSVHATWHRRFCGAVGWLGDSRHWIEFAENRNEQVVDGLLIRDALNPPVCKDIPIQPSTFHKDIPYVTSSDHYLVKTRDGNIGIISHVEVYDGDLNHPDAPSRKYPISLPPNSEINDIVYSPSGDRIAWLLTIASASATESYAPEKAGLEARAGIWVSHLDGSEMHEVGSVPRSSEDAPWHSLPGTIQWLPNGRSLSFLYQDALWTVPAD